MWKMVYGSVRGTSHFESGTPCQDYCSGVGSGPLLVAACADGAGSAERSHLGSRCAVERFLEASAALDDRIPEKGEVEAWIELARDRVLDESSTQDVSPRQLACTFLAAIVGEGWAAFAQVGDGVIVFNGDAGYDLAFWPDNGEYANATRFLTDDDYRDHLRIEIVPRRITELAILTDGLQMLALDFAGARVHDRFFAPLFHTIRAGPDEDALRTSLLSFLDSQRVNERTDDDKTLFLATRSNYDVPASLSDEPS